MTQFAPRSRASVRICSTLPRPTSVAGSGCGERWRADPVTCAPALVESSASSRSVSSPKCEREDPEGLAARCGWRLCSHSTRRTFSPLPWKGILFLRGRRGDRVGGRRPVDDHCRNGVLENKLLLVVIF